MSEHEDEIARGVARALQARDEKVEAKNAEGTIFALSFFILLAITAFLTGQTGLSFWQGMIVTVVASVVLAGVIATTVSRRARARGAPGY